MPEQEIVVNLDLPAGERWKFLKGYQDEVNALLHGYLQDFDNRITVR